MAAGYLCIQADRERARIGVVAPSGVGRPQYRPLRGDIGARLDAQRNGRAPKRDSQIHCGRGGVSVPDFSDAEMLGSPHALPVGVGEAPLYSNDRRSLLSRGFEGQLADENLSSCRTGDRVRDRAADVALTWPAGAPVGRQISNHQPSRQIVGFVASFVATL
jgi:hypothetical protein